MKDKALLVQRWDNLPSQTEFVKIEDGNVPAVFVGALTSWPAYKLWDPSEGGLQHLKAMAGPAIVQAMATNSGTNFYGDIRSHERVPIRFDTFLSLADSAGVCGDGKGIQTNLNNEVRDDDDDDYSESPGFSVEEMFDGSLYLAQVGIHSQEIGSSPPLKALRKDIEIPNFLLSPVVSINLWMSVNGSRSSIHYDPLHNLLCVISGCKEVRLWPPSSAPSLYPLPVYGEASNHSGVDFIKPDLSNHPRFVSAGENCQTVILNAGDALFLPEGWYHQVDSGSLTIAVNLWWQSAISSKLGSSSHMDAYLLRRVVANLVDSEKEKIITEYRKSASECLVRSLKQVEIASNILPSMPDEECQRTQPADDASSSPSVLDECKDDGIVRSKHKSKRHRRRSKTGTKAEVISNIDGKPDNGHHRANEDVKDIPGSLVESLQGDAEKVAKKLTDLETQALRTLVLSVSDSTTSTTLNLQGQFGKEDGDSIAQVFSFLKPSSLQSVLLVMSIDFPRTLEALILHKISPIACEILTRRFEEMDSMSEVVFVPQEEFYKRIYGVFDNPRQAMASLLDGKEAFAAAVLKRVMDRYLGLNCTPVQN